MRGVSRESLADGQERLETLLASPGTDPAALGDALFAVTDVIAANPGLRRALTDPARDGEAKAGASLQVIADQVEGAVHESKAFLADGYALEFSSHQTKKRASQRPLTGVLARLPLMPGALESSLWLIKR